MQGFSCHIEIKKKSDIIHSKLLVLTEYAESKKTEFSELEDYIEREMTKRLSDREAEQLLELLSKVIDN